jgi:hypothetical protein
MTDFSHPLSEPPAFTPHVGAAHLSLVRSCFSDEIDIDFPSMDALVDRMRDALLGDDTGAARLAALVTVTPDQAHGGVVVPLELALGVTCRCCGGRGETWSEPCRACHGSGECPAPHQFTLSVPAGVLDGARFRFLVMPPHVVPTRIDVTVNVA